MIDYMLVVVLIGILVIIYRQMIKVDDVLDTIEHPDVLVIYEDQYKDIKPHGISLASLLETYNSCMVQA